MTILETYAPKHLEKWTIPDCYIGASWPDWFVFLSRHRDSSHLENSNFEQGLKAVKAVMSKDSVDDDDSTSVQVVSENHWAVGWAEWIAIHKSDSAALMEADKLMGRLDDYPILDEQDWSNREWEDYQESWKDYGCQEFIRELKGAIGFSDTLKYFLNDVAPEAMQEFYESLIPSREYYHAEGSGVSIQTGYAAKNCSRDRLARAVTALRGQ